MTVHLRDYQDDAQKAMHAELLAGNHPLCVLPTGSGKSLVLAASIKALYPAPVLVLSHVRELLEQDAAALKRYAPEVEYAFFVASMKEKNPNAPVVFGSVQSVYRSLDLFRTRRAAVFVDEAHLCPRKADAMYSAIFEHFAASPRGGFTATPNRMDSGSLVEGDGAWFSNVAYNIEAPVLIKRGFLVPLSGLLPKLQADLDGVATRAGEFALDQAERAVIKTLSLPEAIRSAKEHASDRKAWLVFAAGIEHAHKVHQALLDEKVSAELVTNETSTEDRISIITRFKAGEFRALVNVGVLTTGFDAPMTDCIISLRPTQSKVLWQQMLGRGMRPAFQKSNCLLLDFVGNLERLGGVGVVSETRDLREENPSKRPTKSKRKGEQRDEPQLQDASTIDPMLTGRPFMATVNKTSFFTVASKRFPGKQILIGAYDLQDEFGRALSARCFLCVEYEGGARYHSSRWFERRGLPRDRMPRSAQAGLLYARALPTPVEVEVRYDRALSCFLVERERFEPIK